MTRPDQYRKVRKNIARVKTELRAQEIGAATKQGAAS
jgi:ribosomal protein L29